MELTARQSQVAELIYQGRTQSQIAAELGITKGTVKVHVLSIRSCLDMPARTALRELPRQELRRRLDGVTKSPGRTKTSEFQEQEVAKL